MATWMFAIFLRGLLVCVVGCVAATAMRGRPAAHRALIWTLTLGALGVLPWLGAVAPSVPLPVLPPEPAPVSVERTTMPAPRVDSPVPIVRETDDESPAVRSYASVEPAPEPVPAAIRAQSRPIETAAATPERAPSTRRPVPVRVPDPVGETATAEVRSRQAGSTTSLVERLGEALAGVARSRVLGSAVAAIWLLGVLVLLLRVGRGWLAAYRLQVTSCEASATVVEELRELARRSGVAEPALRISSEANLPMALHIAEPTILVPVDFSSWPSERRRAVLLHELAHLQRYDTWVQIAARVVVAFHWLNPLAWFALRRLWVERERACDDHVLRSGLLPSSYASHLLELARLPRTPVPAAAASFLRRRHLPDRLRAVLDPELVRESPTRRTLVFATVLALVALVPIAAGQPVAAAAPEVPSTEPEPEAPSVAAASPTTQEAWPAIDELVKMRIHGVSPEFVEAMSAHQDDLDVDTLIQLRIHGVSPEYADSMYAALGETLTLKQLVQGRIHGVSPEFARAAAAQFGRDVAFKDLVQMRIHGASSDYVREMQRLFSHETLQVRDVVQMRIHGASTDFVETMQGLLPDETLDVSDVVQMRIHGVSADMVRDLHDRGIDDLTAEELVQMRIHGMDRILRRRDGGDR